MKNILIQFDINLAVGKLALFVEANINVGKRPRPDQLGFIKTVGLVEEWLKEFDGFFFLASTIHGWTGKKYKYESHFRVENKNEDFKRLLIQYFEKFTLKSNDEMEEIMAIKKAPFSLWGFTALVRELVDNSDVPEDEAKEMTKTELVERLDELVDQDGVEAEPDSGEEVEEVDEGGIGVEDGEELVEVGEDGEELVEVGEDGEEHVKAKEESPAPEEPPPAPIKLGEQKLDQLLEKQGLLDETVKSMTIGDKRTFLAATEEQRTKMKGDIMSKETTTTKAAANETAAKAETPKAETPKDKSSKASTASTKTSTKSSVDSKAKKSTAKKVGPTLNEQLKKKGLWRSGAQFLSSERKQHLLDCDTPRKQNVVFKEIETKLAEIKAKQSKVAKKNMAATKK